MKPKTIAHAEAAILEWLLNGEGASLGNGGLASLAEKMGAGVDEHNNPIDRTAHNRFKKAAVNIGGQLNRLLEQRRRKMGDA